MDSCTSVCVDGHSTVLQWFILLGALPAVVILGIALMAVLAAMQRRRHPEVPSRNDAVIGGVPPPVSKPARRKPVTWHYSIRIGPFRAWRDWRD